MVATPCSLILATVASSRHSSAGSMSWNRVNHSWQAWPRWAWRRRRSTRSSLAIFISTTLAERLGLIHRGGASLSCTRARHFVSRCEWEDATSGSSELASAYPLDDILPLREAGLITVVEDGQELLPGLRGRVTGGHTRGHMSVFFESGGQTTAYLGDICPTTAHLRRMWHLAYDTHPLDTRRRKPALLSQAADEGCWVVWNHDPRVAVSRVARHPKREFVAIDRREAL